MKYFLMLFLMIATFATVLAQPVDTQWVINRDHSEINFSVTYLKFSTVSGRFSDFYGDVSFDDDLQLPNRVEIRIRTASIYTANNLRDGHLKGADFFYSKRFPYIHFSSDKILALAPDQYKVSGVLTIKDVSLPIELRIEMTQTLQDTWKFSSKFAKFSGAINRQAFGLNWNKTFDQQALILGDEISFQGVFQLQPSRKVSVGNKHLIPDSKTMRRLESTTGKYIVDGVKIDQAVSNSAVQKNVEVAEQTDQIIGHRQQTLRQWLWWPAFIFLGLLGFLGTIILAYFIKNKMMQLGANYFRKTFWPEILSDILIILFVFIYSLSYWYVGWGE